MYKPEHSVPQGVTDRLHRGRSNQLCWLSRPLSGIWAEFPRWGTGQGFKTFSVVTAWEGVATDSNIQVRDDAEHPTIPGQPSSALSHAHTKNLLAQMSKAKPENAGLEKGCCNPWLARATGTQVGSSDAHAV